MVELLRNLPFEHAVDLFIDRLDRLLVVLRSRAGRISGAFCVLGRSGGGTGGTRSAACLALDARRLR
jgi:hypothetical protein